jgi:SAM-dependent methyltransferase
MNEIAAFIDYGVMVVQVTLGLFLFSLVSIYLSGKWGAPWIVTPTRIIHQMLDLGNLKPGECIVDLGAGDGRILITAAREYEANGFGLEIDPIRTLLANIFIRTKGVHNSVKVYWRDLFDADLYNVDLVTIYLTRDTNEILRQLIVDKCDPGTRIVSYAFPVPGWSPIIIDDKNLIFVYEVGNTGDDVLVEFV